MKDFLFVAIDPQGEKVRDKISAANLDDAKRQLYKKRYNILSLKEKRKSHFNFEDINSVLEKVKLKDKVVFTRQFAILIDTGVQLNDALGHLVDGLDNLKFKKAVIRVKKDVESGITLSDAFRRHPKIFPELYCFMIESGEKGGNLPSVMNSLADDLEKEADISSKVRGAMIEPAILGVTTIITVVILMIWVIPSFVDFFDSLDAELPFLTKWLIAASNFFVNQWILLLIMVSSLIIGMVFASKSRKGKYLLDSIKLKLPIFGKITKKVAMLRFARTLENLQVSSVPLLESLEIVGQTSGNLVIQKATVNVQTRIKKGEKLKDALSSNKVFPSLLVRMVSIGEESGNLPKVLGKIKEYYQREVDQVLDNLVKLINPLATLILGGIVAIVALAILWPSWSMLDAMRDSM